MGQLPSFVPKLTANVTLLDKKHPLIQINWKFLRTNLIWRGQLLISSRKRDDNFEQKGVLSQSVHTSFDVNFELD